MDATVLAFAHRALSWAMVLLGVPAALIIAWLLVPRALPSDVQPAEVIQRWVEPLQGVPFNEGGFAQLTQRDLSASQASYLVPPSKDWEPVQPPVVQALPVTTERPPNASHRLWLRFSVQVDATQPRHEPVGIYIARLMSGLGGGYYSLWVNGELVHTNEAQWRLQWNRPILVELPLKYSQPGMRLDLAVGVPFQQSQGYAVGSILLGAVPELARFQQLRDFAQQTIPQATVVVVALIGFMSLNFWLHRPQEETHLVMWLSSVAWLISLLQFLVDFNEDDVLSAWFGSLVDSATGWAILLISMFIGRIEREPSRWLERGAMVVITGMSVLTLPVWHWQANALLLQHGVHVLIAVALLVIQLRRSWVTGNSDMWLLTLCMASMICAGLHDLYFITSQQGPDHVFLFPFLPLLLFGMFLHLNQKRYLSALSAVDQTQRQLQEQVDQARQEVLAKHAQRTSLSREQALIEERQLVCSDLHDGLGSALTSAILLSGKPEVHPARLAWALQDCQLEIRSVADTLQTQPGDLTSLLHAIRSRMNTRLAAADLNLDWSMEPLPQMAWMDQRALNDFGRLLQEAMTNAMKHGLARDIRVHVAPQVRVGRAGVLAQVRDNGCGFDPDRVEAGRGLKNLRSRSARLGGHCELQSMPGQGTVVMLWIPEVSA